jgi:hypothetical protein
MITVRLQHRHQSAHVGDESRNRMTESCRLMREGCPFELDIVPTSDCAGARVCQCVERSMFERSLGTSVHLHALSQTSGGPASPLAGHQTRSQTRQPAVPSYPCSTITVDHGPLYPDTDRQKEGCQVVDRLRTANLQAKPFLAVLSLLASESQPIETHFSSNDLNNCPVDCSLWLRCSAATLSVY